MKKLINEDEFQKQLAEVKDSLQQFDLDKGIAHTVALLMLCGFATTMSCEGHLPGNGHVDAFRAFWPYVQINLSKKVVIGFGNKVTVKKADPFLMSRELEELLTEFNYTIHPFRDSEHLEMEFLLSSSLTEAKNLLSFYNSIKKGWNISGLLCDRGVEGIRTLPQELLNDTLRQSFLTRTQDHMQRFTKFLEWNLQQQEE